MAALFFSWNLSAASKSPPEVVVSIAPIHSLVAAVMEGVAEPGLLLSGNASPHHFSLKPSGVRKLHRADLVVWVGPAMESFLIKALHTRDSDKRTLTVATDIALNLLQNRSVHDHEKNAVKNHLDDHEESGSQNKDHEPEHHQDNEDDHGNADSHMTEKELDTHKGLTNHPDWDPHLWLDPGNAIAIVTHLEQLLTRLDPAHAKVYRDNAGKTRQRIEAMDKEIDSKLSQAQPKPFIVQHDAFQYFEKRYELRSLAALTPTEQISASAASVARIIKTIRENKIKCVFREPQLSAGVLEGVAKATAVALVEIDPLGSGLTPGPDLYPQLLEGLSDSVLDCLAHE